VGLAGDISIWDQIQIPATPPITQFPVFRSLTLPEELNGTRSSESRRNQRLEKAQSKQRGKAGVKSGAR